MSYMIDKSSLWDREIFRMATYMLFGIMLAVLGIYLVGTSSVLLSFVGAFFVATGVQVSLWSVGFRVEILGNGVEPDIGNYSQKSMKAENLGSPRTAEKVWSGISAQFGSLVSAAWKDSRPRRIIPSELYDVARTASLISPLDLENPALALVNSFARLERAIYRNSNSEYENLISEDESWSHTVSRIIVNDLGLEEEAARAFVLFANVRNSVIHGDLSPPTRIHLLQIMDWAWDLEKLLVSVPQHGRP